MSKDEMISRFLSIVGPLAGVIVGALIASFTTLIAERQRRKHDRKEKLASLKREALAAALEWFEPMRDAYIRSSSLVMAAISGDVDDRQLLKEWPNLLGVLSKKDVPEHLLAVLPEDPYLRGRRIIGKFDELCMLCVRSCQEPREEGKPIAGSDVCYAKLESLGAEITQFEKDLRKEFRKTFD